MSNSTVSTSETIVVQEVAWSDSIADSGTRLGGIIASELSTRHQVAVSFRGLRGVPSTFFNAMVVRALQDVTPEAIATKVKFEFENDVQEQVWLRTARAYQLPVVGRR